MSQLLQVSHVGVHTGSGNQQFGNGVGVGVGVGVGIIMVEHLCV
jgi:hypothetical protein